MIYRTNYGSYPSPDSYYDEDVVERPRKRREMQAITKIVETREFPYQDNYFWKNNGNTTQKKTGCKSIYYKCSNSNKVMMMDIYVERDRIGTLLYLAGYDLHICIYTNRMMFLGMSCEQDRNSKAKRRIFDKIPWITFIRMWSSRACL